MKTVPTMQAASFAPLPTQASSAPDLQSLLEQAIQLPMPPALDPGLESCADEATDLLSAAVANFVLSKTDEAQDCKAKNETAANRRRSSAGSTIRRSDHDVARTVDISNVKNGVLMVLPDPEAFTVRGDSIVECRDWDTVKAMMESSSHPRIEFEWTVEPIPFLPGHVALRAKGTELYLTATPYGEETRKMYASFFVKCDKEEAEGRGLNNILRVLPQDIVGLVIDFLVDDACPESWMEGPNFHYDAITARRGPPDTSQMFIITDCDHRGIKFYTGGEDERGIRTYFGRYLRAMGGCLYASQSPLCGDDERWEIMSEGEESDDEMDE